MLNELTTEYTFLFGKIIKITQVIFGELFFFSKLNSSIVLKFLLVFLFNYIFFVSKQNKQKAPNYPFLIVNIFISASFLKYFFFDVYVYVDIPTFDLAQKKPIKFICKKKETHTQQLNHTHNF